MLSNTDAGASAPACAALRFAITIDRSRDELLTHFGKETLKDRYLLPGESYQDLFARVACAYADNADHAQRLYTYMSLLWFMPATPVLANGGTTRGLPVSCYLNEVPDSLEGIEETYRENLWLAARGGGIGTDWSNVRSIGERVGVVGETSGIMPFIKVMDSQTLAISQGCVDGDTEILTESGWVRFEDLNSTHGKVLQVNPDKSMSFVDVEEYHKYPYAGKMHFYSNAGGTVDHMVTPNHRMVFEQLRKIGNTRAWTDELRVKESSGFNPNRDNRFYTTGASYVEGDKYVLSAWERFLIAYQADGSTDPTGSSTGSISGTKIYAFRFRKERKIVRLRQILADVGFEYTESTYANGTTSILVRVPNRLVATKNLSDWVDFTQVTSPWCREFIDEMKNWDGKQGSANYIEWFGTNKANADTVNAIAALAGYKTFVGCRERPLPRQTIYDVSICTSRITVGGEEVEKEEVDYDGFVYCVSVPSGMFLARRNGVTVVTGNSLRRGSASTYLRIDHPEIEEFIDMRRPTGGDPNRRSLNLHHGVIVTNAFMRAVENDQGWNLVSPRDGSVQKSVSARDLWIKLLTARIETGEPYILFIDNVNDLAPETYKAHGNKITTSNLCVEICELTGLDHRNERRTAVCCLSSLNLDFYLDWSLHPTFIEDVMRFLDNVMQDFIDRAPDSMARARYSAMRERSVGLGVMGFHSFLQKMGVPFESAIAISWNLKMFKHIKAKVDAASVALAHEKGPCPDAADAGIMERFANKTAVAPTASISIICGGASPGIEPSAANSYVQKTLSGSHVVRNPHLKAVLAKYGRDDQETWVDIGARKGSVQHLDFLTDQERDVFKTAIELDQRWLIEHAADRTPFIDQGQSLNLFFAADAHKKDINAVHMMAWKKGVKGLYYCRSLSVQRAETVSEKIAQKPVDGAGEKKYDECLACQ
jgi:ribonucleoside-diphosphate reductase alpha chain